MEQLKEFIKEFNIVKINNTNIEDVFCLCKRNKKYYEYMQEEASLEGVKNIVTELPPNKTLQDKYFVGFYKDKSLVAILDLINDYPHKGKFFIGLFMVDATFHNKGIGKRIISNLLKCLEKEKYQTCELGVIEDNKEAISFWNKVGFKKTGKVYNHEKYNIVMMSYIL